MGSVPDPEASVSAVAHGRELLIYELVLRSCALREHDGLGVDIQGGEVVVEVRLALALGAWAGRLLLPLLPLQDVPASPSQKLQGELQMMLKDLEHTIHGHEQILRPGTLGERSLGTDWHLSSVGTNCEDGLHRVGSSVSS